MIIAELFPEKVNVTVFVFESTIPVTLSLLAPCKDSTTTTSLYCLVTRSNVSDVVSIVPNTIAVLYICKSILIDFPVISFLFTLLFYPIPTHVQEKFSVPSIWSAVIVTLKPLSLALTSHELLKYIFALVQDTRLILYPTLIIIVALLTFCNTFNMYKPSIPDVIT